MAVQVGDPGWHMDSPASSWDPSYVSLEASVSKEEGVHVTHRLRPLRHGLCVTLGTCELGAGTAELFSELLYKENFLYKA